MTGGIVRSFFFFLNWKYPKCPSIVKWICKMWYIQTISQSNKKETSLTQHCWIYSQTHYSALCINWITLDCCSYNKQTFLDDFGISLIISFSTTILAFILGDFNFPITIYLYPPAQLKTKQTNKKPHNHSVPLNLCTQTLLGTSVWLINSSISRLPSSTQPWNHYSPRKDFTLPSYLSLRYFSPLFTANRLASYVTEAVEAIRRKLPHILFTCLHCKSIDQFSAFIFLDLSAALTSPITTFSWIFSFPDF